MTDKTLGQLDEATSVVLDDVIALEPEGGGELVKVKIRTVLQALLEQGVAAADLSNVVMSSPNGQRWAVSVDNNGAHVSWPIP